MRLSCSPRFCFIKMYTVLSPAITTITTNPINLSNMTAHKKKPKKLKPKAQAA